MGCECFSRVLVVPFLLCVFCCVAVAGLDQASWSLFRPVVRPVGGVLRRSSMDLESRWRRKGKEYMMDARMKDATDQARSSCLIDQAMERNAIPRQFPQLPSIGCKWRPPLTVPLPPFIIFSSSPPPLIHSTQGYNKSTNKLEVVTTANQDPLLSHIPIIGVDIWEHAFYLQYKNVKPDVSVPCILNSGFVPS